ncbi:MAG: hypothetical protein NWE78_03085 [Candidatus Bathyarchaeota archaeon]|nr:hypothetical protein [Candidatus Bathyarchaeota archaeon]
MSSRISRKTILMLSVLSIAISASMVAAISSHIGMQRNSMLKPLYSDAVLFNDQMKLLYTNEAIGIGNYTDDTAEPAGWELFPAIFWDSNTNGVIDTNESIGHTLSPSVHFTHEGTPVHFWPLHQSLMQASGGPTVVSSGWLNYPNKYYSRVEDADQLLTVESVFTVTEGANYFVQEINITSTALSTLTSFNLITYIGIDINGPFDDVAFVDSEHNNMIKAYDNNTGIWFGAYPNMSASGYEVSEWDDGPYAAEDLWQHTLSGTLADTTQSTGEVEASLEFYLNELNAGESKTVTIYYSCAESESGLYAPALDNHDVAICDFTTSKAGCMPVETVGQGETVDMTILVENQGDYTEVFNVTAYANGTWTSHQEVTLDPGQNQTLLFVWDTTAFSKGNYLIIGEADIVAGEADPTDNTFVYGWIFVTIPGDIDGDRDVDIFDIVRMATIYGVVQPDPAYDPNSDIDNDGDIDIFDIVKAAGNYASSW